MGPWLKKGAGSSTASSAFLLLFFSNRKLLLFKIATVALFARLTDPTKLLRLIIKWTEFGQASPQAPVCSAMFFTLVVFFGTAGAQASP